MTVAGSARLVLRALWWRRGLALAVLAVSVVTTTAAALGPLYARAAGESTLNDHLTHASWRAGIHISGTADIGSPGEWSRLTRAVPAPSRLHGYDRRIPGITTTTDVTASAAGITGDLVTPVAWREGACAHLVIVSGHCPDGPGQALMSSRTFAPGSDASEYLAPKRWRIGTRVKVGGFIPADEPGIPGNGTSLQIVGTYRPKNIEDPFWFGRNYFGAHPGGVTPETPPTIDTLMVDRSTMLGLRDPAYVEVDFDYPLTPSAVRLANQRAELAAVTKLSHTRLAHGALSVRSQLRGALHAATGERRLLNTGTLLVTLQLGLLAWLVLFQVVADAIEARGNEIAMAKLRGHSPLATIRFGLGEPLLLLILAVPVGILAAWGVTLAFAAAVLAEGSPVVLTLAPVWAALVAFAGGLVAAAVAGYRTLTRSVLDQWRRTTRRPGHGRLAIVADGVLAAAALAALFVLRGEHDPRATHDSAALLTPGLLVFAVAVIGVRLLPLACRVLARRTRASRRVSTFLASRQVSRRPVGLRLAALLAVAVGLATFAVAGESVATTNRQARAAAELGAARVASVQYEPGHDPVAATRRADPHGRWAMAAATWLPDGGDSVLGTVLAVDGSRLAAVGNHVSGGPRTATLAREVSGAAVPVVTTSATRIRVHLDATGLKGDVKPQVEVDLQTSSDPYLGVPTGTLRAGRGTYSAGLPCTSTAPCTLRGLTWVRPIQAVTPLAGTIVLTGIDLYAGGRWTPVDLHLHTAHSWRMAVPEGQATDDVSVAAHGVRDAFSNRNGGQGGIAYGSSPSPIPAVAAPAALATGDIVPTPRQLTDALGITVTFHVVRTVRLVPVLLTQGVVMDVGYLDAELPAFREEADWQVWLGPHAPSDAVARLRAAGLNVQSVHSQAHRETLLARQGPALALLLLLACAVAGAVLAVGATAISISASSRRRSYEIAALRAVGLTRRSLLRASVLEQLLLLGTGVVLGVPMGLIAARLAMPVIPEFADTTPITLRYVPQVVPVLVFAGAFVVLLGGTAWISGRALIRLAVPSRLREVEG